MLYLVEYERPAADYPGPDGDNADFETMFEGPAITMGALDYNLVAYIADYGRANGATAAHVFKYEAKSLSDNGFRLPGGQELVGDIDVVIGALKVDASLDGRVVHMSVPNGGHGDVLCATTDRRSVTSSFDRAQVSCPRCLNIMFPGGRV